MNRIRTAWLAGLASAAFAVPVLAAEPAGTPSPEELFGKLDKNADGTLAGDEVGEDQLRFFERLVRVGDKDGNGVLSKEEFLKGFHQNEEPIPGRLDFGRQPRRPDRDPKRAFERLDANKDGKLTLEEMPEPIRERLRPLFERQGKTELTQQDWAEMHRRREELRKGRRPGEPGGSGPEAKEGDPEKGGPGPQDRPESHDRHMQRLFDRLDANGDDRLTADELEGRIKDRIERRLMREGKDLSEGITREEFGKLMGGPRFGGPGRPDGPEPPGRPEGPQRPDGRGPERPDGDGPPRRPGPHRLPRFFERLDADGDHCISPEELSKAAELFDELDENGDGKLDPREMLGPPPGEGEPRPR